MLGAPTRVLEVVKKQTGGLLWKVQRMTKTRRANAKARHARTHQVEDILRACAQEPQPDTTPAPPAGTAEVSAGTKSE
ncbi:hypothetical protein KFL_006820070 [Klebsormidium nitens]|uniref:Uncharacterized protein n=1 Tax=Klebsormidium nitens TaxID=105231 RepID=A0A1Y1IMU0_KLENI|nr:hypothetical protein KFL_006820070 [Klebsormidium nitens]|eukprot:GAQ90769.1 hypothetical protein KFL_006820070 [Klebsormidium nitens]